MGKFFKKKRQIEERVLRGYVYISYNHAVYLCFAFTRKIYIYIYIYIYFFFMADHKQIGETIISHRFVTVAIPNMKYLPKEGEIV